MATAAARLRSCRRASGLSAAVYTQITDVETELNGLLTYDRRGAQAGRRQVRAANRRYRRRAAPPAAVAPAGHARARPASASGRSTRARGTVAHDAGWRPRRARVGNGRVGRPGTRGSALQLGGGYADTGASLLDTTGNYSVAAWVKLDSLGGFATAVSQDGAGSERLLPAVLGRRQPLRVQPPAGRALAPARAGAGPLVPPRRRLRRGGRAAEAVRRRRARRLVRARCPDAATGHTVIGRGQFGGNQVDFWRGAVDQVHVYDRALSDAEVRDLYASGS